MNQSIFQQALGEDFNKMPLVLQKHYFNYSVSNPLIIRGEMSEVYHSLLIKPVMIIAALMKTLVPYRGENIPTSLFNWTDEENTMYWRRILTFPGKKPVEFKTYMILYNDHELIEYINPFLGLLGSIEVNGNTLSYKLKKYIFKIGPIKIFLPSFLGLGSGYINETAVSDNEIVIDFKLRHPLLGYVFGYQGKFTVYA